MSSIHPDYKLGDNIRRLRRSHGLTQEQVSAKLDVLGIPMSRSRYAKIETDRTHIRVKELVALRRIFKCSFDDFFVGLDEILQSEINAVLNSNA